MEQATKTKYDRTRIRAIRTHAWNVRLHRDLRCAPVLSRPKPDFTRLALRNHAYASLPSRGQKHRPRSCSGVAPLWPTAAWLGLDKSLNLVTADGSKRVRNRSQEQYIHQYFRMEIGLLCTCTDRGADPQEVDPGMGQICHWAMFGSLPNQFRLFYNAYVQRLLARIALLQPTLLSQDTVLTGQQPRPQHRHTALTDHRLTLQHSCDSSKLFWHATLH